MMYHRSMRTTVTLDDDVAAAVERLRRDRSIGLSEAINELIRVGLTVKRPRRPFQQRTEHIGFKVDVTNVAEALELLEGPAAR
jgi:Arc/MetJ family transcription regulator